MGRAGANAWAPSASILCLEMDGHPRPPPSQAAQPVLAAQHVRLTDSQFKMSLILAKKKKKWEKAKARVE